RGRHRRPGGGDHRRRIGLDPAGPAGRDRQPHRGGLHLHQHLLRGGWGPRGGDHRGRRHVDRPDGATGNREPSLVTTDGGATWTNQPLPATSKDQLNAVACPATSTCYVVGNAFTGNYGGLVF